MKHGPGACVQQRLERTRRSHRLLLIGFLTLFVPAACFAAYAINRFEKLGILEEEAVATVRGVAADVGRLETVLSTLTSMHHLLQNHDAALPTLAESLRERTPWITSMGRYRQIAPEERADFETDMEGRGLYDFRLRDLDASGHANTSPVRDRAFPIASLEPMTPRNLQLFGADLAAVDGLSTALASASASGREHLIAVPAGWPSGGQFMLFSPVYRGQYVPSDVGERLRQADGGYWMTIDPVAMLSGVDSPGRRFDISVQVQTRAGTTGEQQLPGVRRTGLILPGLYPAHTRDQAWPFGSSRLVVRMRARYGMSERMMVLSALLIVLSAALMLLFISASRQRADQLLEQERGRQALDAERQKAQTTLDAISDAVISVDRQARIRRVNPAAIRLLERPADALYGERLDTLINLHHRVARHERARAFTLAEEIGQLPEQGERRFELTRPTADEHTGLQVSLSRAGGVRGSDDDVIIVLRDTSAEQRFTRELEYQASHDALTGCTNRLHFEQQLERLAAESAPDDPGYALLYMDLDQFKAINDTAGHAAGDRLLVELTGELRAMLRENDILCRLGGDEFGMIIVDATPEHARAIAERIYQAFQSLVFSHEDHAFAVRASLGLVHCSQTGGRADDLMAAADVACYAAKENGRNDLSEYSAADADLSVITTEMNWLPRLQRALDRDEFLLYAQPITALAAHPEGAEPIPHFELLLRLKDDDGGEITGGQIVRAADRYGLMGQIDRWVISRALQRIARMQATGAPAGFSINLSGQSATDATLVDFIGAQYALHGIDPSRIWFEMTETAAISHFATAVELANGIRALGSKVALDDFGSGLSSFGYLKNLPVDVLKIDGQFVRELASNPIDREMVRAISQIARAMNIRTVAEFVENERTLEVLTEIGIDHAQGFHIARPAPWCQARDGDGDDVGRTLRDAA